MTDQATRDRISEYWAERLARRPVTKPKPELAPCGSVSAYKRHLAERKRARQRGEREPEIDDACKKAWAERWNEYAKASGDATWQYGRSRTRSASTSA